MSRHGLFTGLITLDFIYLVQDLPDRNQKIVALDYTLAAGGPATNAAVTFQHLGNCATVLGVLGKHPLSRFVEAELQQQNVAVVDLQSNRIDPLPTSSIFVTQATGDRAVVSLNAVQAQVGEAAIPAHFLSELDSTVEIVLIDGHQPSVGHAIAKQAKSCGIPVVVDAGSWKPGFEQILPYADYVICSANFHPPNTHSADAVFAYLENLHIPYLAITQGAQPILWRDRSQSGEIPVAPTQPVDTLGAGDVLHGAFCHFILHHDFPTALSKAAAIASYSCQFFGTRAWLQAHSRES